MRKGFTLVELLIVIAILAILATVVVLVLNPAQLLAEARDGQRLSDLSTVQSVLTLYLTTVNSPDLDNVGQCRTKTGVANFWASISGVTSPFVAFSAPETSVAQHANTARTVDGAGWVPVVLTNTSGGSPVAVLPIDPTNTAAGCSGNSGCFYAYSCNDTAKTFELNTNMESLRYAQGGGSTKEDTDGGNQAALYEVGNDPGLDL